jgi:hypothetical protein
MIGAVTPPVRSRVVAPERQVPPSEAPPAPAGTQVLVARSQVAPVPHSESFVQSHPTLIENPAAWHAFAWSMFCTPSTFCPPQEQHAAVGVATQLSTTAQGPASVQAAPP